MADGLVSDMMLSAMGYMRDLADALRNSGAYGVLTSDDDRIIGMPVNFQIVLLGPHQIRVIDNGILLAELRTLNIPAMVIIVETLYRRDFMEDT